MSLLEALALAFFRSFGITQPTPQASRRAAWFLFSMTIIIFLGLCGGAVLIFHFVRS